METKITVQQVDHNCKPTKKGDPQIGVKYDKGWIKISGGNVRDVQAGDVLVLGSEPTQFGKSWYGRLEKIERPNGKAASSVQAVSKITLDEVLDVIDRVLMRLPADWRATDCIHGQRACAQIVNTVIMGVESGQIAVDSEPDLPDAGPVPTDNDLPPWERG